MHNIKSVFYGLIIGLTILLGIAIAVSLIYEDEVSQYLIEELNEQLLSEIDVKKVNLTFLKKFPNASIEFKDVVAYTKKPYSDNILSYDTDTLFSAQNLSIQINIIDLIAKRYIVKGVHLNKGNINLFIDKQGNPNYIFWEVDKENKAEKEFEIDINKVKVSNCKVLFINESTKLIIKAKTKRLDFKGNFSNRNFLMKIHSEMFVDLLKVKDFNYILNKNLKSDLVLDIIDKDVKISNGKINFNDLSLELNGDIQRSDSKNIDILVSGKNLDVKDFVDALPKALKKEISNIQFTKGNATLTLNVFGKNIQRQSPGVNALFIINDADVLFSENKLKLQKLNIEGEYTNGELRNIISSKIKLKSIETNIGSSAVAGLFEITNFNNPSIKLDLNSDIYLDELKNTFQLDTFEILSGRIESNFKYVGLYNDLKKINLPDLFTQEYEVDLTVYDAKIKYLNNPIVVSELSGDIYINKDLKADSLHFNIGKNDFLINGQLNGLYNYFKKQSGFTIDAELKSRKVDLNELAPLFKVNKQNEINSSYKFPDYVSLNLNLDIENFRVGKFNATAISGKLNYKPRMFSLHEISFQSMNGTVRAGGVIIQKYNNNFAVRSQSQLNGINMNKLFYSFNNFGQGFITNQNIQGDLTGTVLFNSDWSDKLDIDRKSVVAECNINVVNGELNNFEPMLGLSRFIHIDDLKSIQFSEFENKITIKNENIYIPQMDIESSALNLSASGQHSFNGEYTYHVSLLLSDLLTAKFKKSKDKEHIGDVEENDEGKIHLNLLLQGDKENFKVKRDKKSARQRRKENLQKEKTELKSILKDEFGKTPSDSVKEDKTQDHKFEIEFDKEKTDQKKKSAKEPQKEPKFIIEWEEDSTLNN